MKGLLASFLTVIAAACAAAPADPRYEFDLDRGFPVDIEDAYPTEPRKFQGQVGLRYERTDAEEDSFEITPGVQYGFAPLWHAELSVPLLEGNAKKPGGGDVRLGALYNFLQETAWPALAVAARVDLPTGRRSRGFDSELTLIATKSLRLKWLEGGSDRIHANASWFHNSSARDREREHYYRLAVGYSRRLSDYTFLVGNVLRQLDIMEGGEENIIEAGLVHQLSEDFQVSIGGGKGMFEESPDYRITFGLQYNF